MNVNTIETICIKYIGYGTILFTRFEPLAIKHPSKQKTSKIIILCYIFNTRLVGLGRSNNHTKDFKKAMVKSLYKVFFLIN
jgi:hypothetical protein